MMYKLIYTSLTPPRQARRVSSQMYEHYNFRVCSVSTISAIFGAICHVVYCKIVIALILNNNIFPHSKSYCTH